jgi:hypothetical protein
MKEKNPLNRQWFYRGFRKQLKEQIGPEKAALIWSDAGNEYSRILSERPTLKAHKGSMVLPAIALYRALSAAGVDTEPLLNTYGDRMGKRFAGIVHGFTSLPGVSRFIWKGLFQTLDFDCVHFLLSFRHAWAGTGFMAVSLAAGVFTFPV